MFFEKKKQPLPVNLQKGKWGEQFKRMLQSTPFYVSSSDPSSHSLSAEDAELRQAVLLPGGSCSSVKAGNTAMSAEQVSLHLCWECSYLCWRFPQT